MTPRDDIVTAQFARTVNDHWRQSTIYRCPVCSLPFGDDVPVCPHDGARLAPQELPEGAVVAGLYRIERRGWRRDEYVARASEGGMVSLRFFGPGAAPDIAAAARFRRAAAVLARFRHPSAAVLVDSGVAPAIGPYLVWKLPEGVVLAESLARSGPLAPEIAAAVVRAVCHVVQAAHDQGLTHGALGADSIHIEIAQGAPVVKVSGFGAESLLKGDLLAGGTLGDTAAADSTADELRLDRRSFEDRVRSDVGALVRVFLEALTGRASSDLAGVDPAALPPGCPPWLMLVATWAMSPMPAARFRAASELARALRPPALAEESADSEVALSGTIEAVAPGTVLGSNLPRPITSFIGRQEEVTAVATRLAESRLVTLFGPGGIGKTRLGLAVGASLRFRFSDGVWFVELGPLTDPDLVAHEVAVALGLREEPETSIEDTLLASLRDRETLLVFDNCEHVVRSVADLAARILSSCPRVWLLATSRETVGVPGEVLWGVPALSLPEAGASEADSDAVRLFVDRARSSHPKFALTEASASVVAELCRRLEGMPLAIELAAARVRVLSPEAILERLSDRFRLLTGGGRTRPQRQQTLRAAVDWSYDLLDERDRLLFMRLSLFAGGFSLEAAEAVCAAGGGLSRWEVLDALGSLADKSLVRVEERAGEARYRMLETIREYAAERLAESGGAAEPERRFLAWAVDLAGAGSRGLAGPEAGEWMARFEAEYDNLRAAFERACQVPDPEAALRIAGGLFLFWNLKGFLGEGRGWLERALAIGGDATPSARARAQLGYGVLLEQQGERERGCDVLRASVELFRSSREAHETAYALSRLGAIEARLGKHAEARRTLDESLTLAQASGDEVGVANATFGLGYAAIARGDYDEGVSLYERCLMLYEQLGHRQRVATVLHNFGNVRESQGRLDEAEALLTRAIEISEELRYDLLGAAARSSLAEVVLARGNVRRAFGLYAEALGTLARAGDRTGIAYTFEGCACAAAAAGDAWPALRLAGAAAALRDELKTSVSDDERATLEERLAPAREAIGEEQAAREIAIGRNLGLDRAIAYARDRAAAYAR